MTDQPARKRYRLKKLRLDEISLVDVGADEHARVAVYKRHDDADVEKYRGQPRVPSGPNGGQWTASGSVSVSTDGTRSVSAEAARSLGPGAVGVSTSAGSDGSWSAGAGGALRLPGTGLAASLSVGLHGGRDGAGDTSAGTAAAQRVLSDPRATTKERAKAAADLLSAAIKDLEDQGQDVPRDLREAAAAARGIADGRRGVTKAADVLIAKGLANMISGGPMRSVEELGRRQNGDLTHSGLSPAELNAIGASAPNVRPALLGDPETDPSRAFANENGDAMGAGAGTPSATGGPTDASAESQLGIRVTAAQERLRQNIIEARLVFDGVPEADVETLARLLRGAPPGAQARIDAEVAGGWYAETARANPFSIAGIDRQGSRATEIDAPVSPAQSAQEAHAAAIAHNRSREALQALLGARAALSAAGMPIPSSMADTEAELRRAMGETVDATVPDGLDPRTDYDRAASAAEGVQEMADDTSSDVLAKARRAFDALSVQIDRATTPKETNALERASKRLHRQLQEQSRRVKKRGAYAEAEKVFRPVEPGDLQALLKREADTAQRAAERIQHHRELAALDEHRDEEIRRIQRLKKCDRATALRIYRDLQH